MKIIRDEQLATLTFVPVEADEEQVIASIAAMLKPEDKMSYGGRGQDGDDDKFCIVHLHAGGRKKKRSETSGNATMHRTVHVDSVELVLRGTTEKDKHEVNRIRDVIDKNYAVEGDLRRDINLNIKRLIEIGSYRGQRHRRNLPSRGQRTRTNARTQRGTKKTVAGRGQKRGMAKK